MTGVRTPAPTAPGRLGEAPDPQEVADYLAGLDAWLAERRRELDRLDAAVLAAEDPEAHSADVVLALTLWRAVQDRSREIAREWDGGRADRVARESVARLVWGRLSSGDGAALVSLVEAVRLCDALVTSLAARLSFEPDVADVRARVRALRSALVRCEDAGGDVARERAEIARIEERTARGADESGTLRELESALARVERDLIVTSARRHAQDSARDAAGARAQALAARAPTLGTLVARVRREIADPPRLAVPDVARLGPVPDDAAGVAAYVARLDAVDRAMETIEDVYTAPLRERAGLRYRTERLTERARANGRAGSATVRSGIAEAVHAVGAEPCDLPLARFYVEQLEVLARALPARAPARDHAPGDDR
ncbi:hypothetical protein [Cellulomonas sp. PhB143]|uniref:hypothetical protein n=1 Tax=Cellulomonas sp. PhB143 TaxID=2485186 RepID=UPI000F4A2C76|nr:hypothetical protein [Cellulomonas sp. PhB143]ROS77037.1 hypothetical protein EDF32_1028 [Cellulomonas sp. PhB143]